MPCERVLDVLVAGTWIKLEWPFSPIFHQPILIILHHENLNTYVIYQLLKETLAVVAISDVT